MSNIINDHHLVSQATTAYLPICSNEFQFDFLHTYPPIQHDVYAWNPLPLMGVNDNLTPILASENLSNRQLNAMQGFIPSRPIPDVAQQTRGVQRKTRAPILRADLWKQHKAHIIELYVVQDKELVDVQQIMKSVYGFDATRAQYLRKVRTWKIDKNIKLKEMQVIVRKRQFRKVVEKHKRPLRFMLRGNVVADGKIGRWMKTRKISDNDLYLARPTIVTTPSIVCQTISDQDLGPSSDLPSVKICGQLSASELQPSNPDALYDLLFDDLREIADMPYSPGYPAPSASTEAPVSQLLISHTYERYNTIPDGLGSESVLSFDVSTADQTMTEIIEDHHNQPGETSSNRLAQAQDPSLDSYGKSSVRTAQRSDSSHVDQGEIKSAETVLRPSRADYSNEAYGKEDFMTSIFRLTNQLRYVQDEDENENADNVDNAKPTASQCLEDEKTRLLKIPVDEFEQVCSYLQSQLMMGMSRGLQAGELLKSMISKAKKLLGEDGWLVLWARADLASIYQQRGLFSEARAMHFDILRRSERVLGPTSWLTLATIWNLSQTYRSQGSLRIAEKLNLRALDLSKCTLGDQEISTLDLKHSLGKVYQQQGRLKDATRLYIQTKEGYEKVFGQDYGVVLSLSQELEELRKLTKEKGHGTK